MTKKKPQYQREYAWKDDKWVETRRRRVKYDKAEGTYTPTGKWNE